VTVLVTKTRHKTETSPSPSHHGQTS